MHSYSHSCIASCHSCESRNPQNNRSFKQRLDLHSNSHSLETMARLMDSCFRRNDIITLFNHSIIHSDCHSCRSRNPQSIRKTKQRVNLHSNSHSPLRLGRPYESRNLQKAITLNNINSQYYIYILTNNKNRTLYIGVTNNIERRVYEHKTKLNDGFTKKYGLDKLIYLEAFFNINDAIKREKNIKKWKRQWKIELIEKENPNWNDLSKGWYD